MILPRNLSLADLVHEAPCRITRAIDVSQRMLIISMFPGLVNTLELDGSRLAGHGHVSAKQRYIALGWAVWYT